MIEFEEVTMYTEGGGARPKTRHSVIVQWTLRSVIRAHGESRE
jgi:hypothetical protein